MNYQKRLIFICLIILVFLSSCTGANKQVLKQVNYNITKGSDYTYYASSGRNSIDCETFSTEHVNYYFETKNYTEKQISDFINKVETLRAFFENELKISIDESLSLYISNKNVLRENNGKIYLSDLNLNNVDVTTVFLQSLFEDNINYGLCYGLACYANEKLYSEPVMTNISITELKQYYSSSENMSLMDLTIPVFQTIYFNEKQNQYACATSYYFVKDLIDRKGLEYTVNLLKNSSKLDIAFDIEYANEKNIWLVNIDATEQYQAVEIPIRYEQNFGKGKNTYPYIVYSPSTISRFVPNNEFADDKIIMNYDYIKHYLTMYEQDISALKNYLSPYFDIKKDAIECYFGGKFEKDFYFYDNIEYVNPLWNGVHEYSHYITMQGSLPLWMSEGLAEYCSNQLENKDVFRMRNEYYNNKGRLYLDLYNKNITNANEKIDNSYLSFSNEVYAFNSSKGVNAIEDTISWYDISRKDEEGANLSYSEAASLVNYLIKTYGEKEFFEMYKDYSDTKLQNTYGKTFKELKEEWLTELNSSIMFEYITYSDGVKLLFTDTNSQYLPSKHSFVDILEGRIYEYVDCGLARNNDDETDPSANDFEDLDLKGKIALIQRGTKGKFFFYKQVNNAAKAGAVGVIVYNNVPGYVSMSLKGVEQDVPAIAILMEDGELLKNAKDKRVTISKDFFGIIDNSPTDN